MLTDTQTDRQTHTQTHTQTHADEYSIVAVLICQKGFQRIIRRTFTYMDENMFLTLYKSLVCPVLEYCSTVWSTYYKKDSERIEKVQRKATKLVRTIKDWDYSERLKHLKLPSSVYRRRRADLLQVFRYFKGLDLLKGDELFTVDKSAKTRGHSLKLVKARVNKKTCRKPWPIE